MYVWEDAVLDMAGFANISLGIYIYTLMSCEADTATLSPRKNTSYDLVVAIVERRQMCESFICAVLVKT